MCSRIGAGNRLQQMMPAMSEYHSNFASARESAGLVLNASGPGRAGQTNPFARLDWFELLHRHCLAGTQPMFLAAHDRAAAAQCWLPLMLPAPGQAAALANWYSFVWQPLWAGDPAPALRQHLLRMIATDLRDHAVRLVLAPLPSTGTDASDLATAFGATGWTVATEATGSNHWLDTGGRSFADWWAARPGALRSTVQRKGKKGLVTITITDRFSDSGWDDYEHVYRNSWKPAEATPAFLREWARSASDDGTLRLGIATIAAEPVAAQFWTCDHGTAYIHKLAHVAGHDALSPGTLLTHAMFAHAFDVDHVARIDFGTGDDGYKRDWMEASAPLLTLHAWDLRQPASWPDFARHRLSRLASRVRGR